MVIIIDENRIPEILSKWTGFLIELNDTLAIAIQEAIIYTFPKSGPGWEPLHDFTIKTKGSTGILVDSGQLRNSIMVHPEDIGKMESTRRIGVFIDYSGYHVDERRFPQTQRKNILVAHLAHIHEFGTVINVTDRMRRFLHAVGLHIKDSTTKIIIPERSFLRTGWDEIEPDIVPSVIEHVNAFFLTFAVDVI